MRRQRRKERRRNTLKSTFRNLEPLEDRLLLAADFGDAPAPYPIDAQHTATGPRLGATRDMETAGIPSPLANSDGADEDGVTFGRMRTGQQATVSINTQNHTSQVRIDAWVDFDGDGNWGGPGEQILDSRTKNPGDTDITFDVPAWSVSGRSYARVRVSTAGQLGHGGTATDGEVEDYVVDIQPAFGPGTFPFDAQQILPGNADGAFTVAAADIDGDGDQDVISGSRNDDSIRWYENVNGTFGPNSDKLISSSADDVRSVFAADINGDGLMDIVAGSTGDDTIAWYRQRPFQTWAKEVIFTGADSVREVTSADMDGDGDMDILSASVNDDMIRWYRNDGNSGFTVQNITQACTIQSPCNQFTPMRIDGARAVAAADMDSDGDMDVVAAAYHDDLIVWYERRGPNVWAAHSIDTLADGASSVAITDLDGDGDMDIAAASQLDNTVAWYENIGAGAFTKGTVSSFVPSAIDVIAADMDGDGDTDLVNGRNEGASINVHLNDGNGNFQRELVDVHSSIFLNVRPIAVAAADFTGDGALDIVTAQLGLNRFVVHPKRIEIDLDNADVTINGIDAGDTSGRSVSSAGDVNGDGFDDLIIGAQGGNESTGESYVVFGGASPSPVVDLSSLGNDGITINGIDAGDTSGRSVSSAGDVNGDGFDDLIIGARKASPSGVQNAGESYVVFGSASPSSVVDLSSLGNDEMPAVGITINGIDAGDYSGDSVSSAGDVNGDGFDDLIIGALRASPSGVQSAGESYVVFGSASPSSEVDLSSLGNDEMPAVGITINGIDAGDNSGRSVSGAGDVNGDGFDDVIIGATSADGEIPNTGESYVVFGSASPSSVVDLSSLGINQMPVVGIKISGKTSDFSGYSVSSAGDVNGDGFDDLIIGSTGEGYGIPGRSYVVFGGASPSSVVDLASLGGDGITINGDAYDYSGRSVSGAGDVNGDGFDDLIIGTRHVDGPGVGFKGGESYVVFGSASPSSVVDLSSVGSEGIKINGTNVEDFSSGTVSGAGDVNGDGFDDLIIGVTSNADRTGESYVIYGRDFTGNVTDLGTHLADVFNGDASQQIMLGGRGDDTLIGGGGPDVLRGGQGNDVLSVSDFNFQRIAGGNGEDTLKFDGISIIDFSNIPDNRVMGIERIDLRDGILNLLEFNRLEVLNISDESNRLLIFKDVGDTVDLGDGWTDEGFETVEGQSFQVWEQGQARVLISGVPVNGPPTVTNQAFSIAENSGNGTLVGIVSASDPNGDALTYSITGGSGTGVFGINAGNGRITVANSNQLNFEATASYLLNVRVRDPDGATDTAVMTVNLTNVNESPSISNQTFSVLESASNGTQVGTLSSSDPDAGDSRTYQIVGGNGGGAFAVNANNGSLTVANSNLVSGQSQWQLTTRVTDSGGLNDTATITVNVVDQNQAPNLNNATFAIAENSANGSLVGILNATDPDAGDVLTYAITGGSGNGIFGINAGNGRITVANQGLLDFESAQSYALNVRVTDSAGATDTALVTVNVTNLNESPTIANQSFSVLESAGTGFFVGLVSAVDPDFGDAVSYQITAGNPGTVFGLNAGNGVLTIANASLLGSQSSWQLTVRATDPGGLSNTATITVNVIGQNQAPNLNNATFSIAENSANGSLVGIVTATDPNAGEVLSYQVTGGTGSSAFAINSANGRITVANQGQLDFETTPSFSLNVRVTDSGGLSDGAVVTINLTDQNEDLGGDFTGDGVYNCFDVDALVSQVVIGSNSAFFDLTGDDLVNDADVDRWLANAGSANLLSGNAYLRGDANLDGNVSSSDLNRLALNWQQGVSGWCAADFTADGVVNSADLNQLALNWQQDASPAALPARIPRAPLPVVLPKQPIRMRTVAPSVFESVEPVFSVRPDLWHRYQSVARRRDHHEVSRDAVKEIERLIDDVLRGW